VLDRQTVAAAERGSGPSQAGVKSFVFTGDHGFLLQDRTVVEKKHGMPSVPDRRQALEDQPGAYRTPIRTDLWLRRGVVSR
jgi:hypothetical protein